MTSFDLQGAVREIIELHPDAELDELVNIGVLRIPLSQREECLRKLLPTYISTMLRTSRNAALHAFAEKRNKDDVRQPNPSPKLRDIRAGFKRFCAQRVHVGSAWLTLGECGHDELKVCISERESHIDDVRSQIENYEALAALLDEHGVERIDQLPPETVCS